MPFGTRAIHTAVTSNSNNLTMHRDFYLFGIFFLGLYVIAALFQSIIFFQIDYQMYQLQSFAYWFIAFTSTSLICSWIILKYYHYKSYRFAFAAGFISLIAVLLQYIIFYFFYLLQFRALQGYYISAVIFSLGTGLLYAISLVFSNAGKNIWLRTTGIFMMIFGIFSVYLLILSLNVDLGQPNNTITELSQ